MRFIQPVADVRGFVGRLNRIERQYADQRILPEDQKHFGVAALVQHLVTLHVASGVIFSPHVLRPVKGGLQIGSVFDDEVMQFGGVALFDGAKLECVRYGNSFGLCCGHCPSP